MTETSPAISRFSQNIFVEQAMVISHTHRLNCDGLRFAPSILPNADYATGSDLPSQLHNRNAYLLLK